MTAQHYRPIRAGFGAEGALTVCRLCGCDDDHACRGADGAPCRWVLLDIAEPTGICSACAERLGWHRFFLATREQAP